MTATLVWKPLDVEGLRLYRVTTVIDGTTAPACLVLATSPNEAKRTLERLYGVLALMGHEVNVLQPGDLT
jgi:hypothetical protein